MVLYGIILLPLAEELRYAYFNLLSPFYDDDAVFDGLARKSAAQLHLLIERGPDQGYFRESAKSLFITNDQEYEEEVRWEFDLTGLNITYVDGRRYLGDYLGPREELYAWVRPKVEAWTHRVSTLAKIANQYPQSV